MRAVATIAVLLLGFLGFSWILGTNQALATWIAIPAAVTLAVLYVRGPEPIFAWITGDHPDAKGSLDTEPENTP